MEKRTLTIIAVIAVVAIVIAGVFAFTTMNGNKPNKTVYYSIVAPGLQKTAISNGTVSAGVSWEPYVSDSVVAGTGKILIWSGDVWENHPCCVIATRTAWAESGNNAELLARIIKADIVANQWLENALSDPTSPNYTKALEIGAAFSGRSTVVVENATEHIKFVSEITQQVKDYMAFYVDQFIDLNIVTSAKLQERGFSNSTNYINNIVDLSYYQAAQTIQPSSTILGTVSMGYLTGDLHQFARVIAMNTTLWGGQTLFEMYGVTVTTPNPAGFSAGPAVMTAFAANAIDVAYLGAPPALQQRINAGTDIKIVALANAEGSAIVVANSINTFADLANKTVATPGPGSIQHLLLIYYANQQGYEIRLAGT
ncbi:MAG: alkanesulfonate transporter substrate-binding subunit [Methanomassiliicoccales archaeon PtaU1.Bin124]|nr:MAG: alkanesulfonate transporter substrate-binding subunit [Methanomassiliicoccales archaeon PtaU1.Bin124]